MTTLSLKCNECSVDRKTANTLTIKLILSKIAIFKHNYKTRKALQKLNSDQLADIGLTQKEAEAEYSKPFWQ